MTTAPEPLYVETYGDRLHKAMKVAGLDAKSLSEKAGLSRESIGSYLHDRTVPRKGYNQLLAWALDAPAEWLATGVRPDDPDDGQLSSSARKSRLATVHNLARAS